MRAISIFIVACLVLGSVGIACGWQQGSGISNAPAAPQPYAADRQYPTPAPQQPYPNAYPAPPPLPPSQAYSTNQGTVPQQQAPGYSEAQTPVYPYPPHHNPYYDGASPKDLLANTVEWVLSFPATLMGTVSNFVDDHFFPRVPATSGSSSGPPPQSASPQPAPDPAVSNMPHTGATPGGN